MNNGKLLAKALMTMMESWGGDTPPECYWAMSEMIKFINKETGSKFKDLDGDEPSEGNSKKLEKLMEFLESDDCNK